MAEEADDDAVVDSWEDFEENPEVLDQQLKKMSLKSVKSHEKESESVMLVSEENQRSNPYNAQEPKIMILQRPQKTAIELPNGITSQKQKIPVKSLQQRQAEYAEARLRILGNSGSPPEEVKLKPLLQNRPIEQNCESPFAVQSNRTNSVHLPENAQSGITFSGGVKPIAFIKPSPVSVARPPRGPSTTQIGFQNRTGSSNPS